MGNRHLIAGQGNAIIVINRNIDHFFDLADGTTRERFVLPHANAEPDAEKGVSVEIMDHTRLKAIGLDDVFDGQTPQVRVLRHPHPTHTRSHATARRTPDSRMHRARTTHAPRTQARDADREAQDLAPQVAPLARARGRGTKWPSRRLVPRRRPLTVRLPGERGAARAPGGKSTRRSSRTRATGARSVSTSRPPHRAQRRVLEPCGRIGGGVTATAPGFVMPALEFVCRPLDECYV